MNHKKLKAPGTACAHLSYAIHVLKIPGCTTAPYKYKTLIKLKPDIKLRY